MMFGVAAYLCSPVLLKCPSYDVDNHVTLENSSLTNISHCVSSNLKFRPITLPGMVVSTVSMFSL